jgi:hypothetical protein
MHRSSWYFSYCAFLLAASPISVDALALSRESARGPESDHLLGRNENNDADLRNMTLSDVLRSMQSHDFADQHMKIRRSQPKCGILWFYHIPKCGGTALLEWIDRMRQNGYFNKEFVRLSYTAQQYENRTDINDIVAWLETLAVPGNPPVIVHHHQRGPGLYGFNLTFMQLKEKVVAAGCQFIRMTVLRKPVDRLISELYYNKILRYGAQDPPQGMLNLYKQWLMNNFHYDNWQVRFLLNNKMEEYGDQYFHFNENEKPWRSPTSDATWEVALKASTDILSEFDYVGQSEKLNDIPAIISSMIGSAGAEKDVPLRLVNSDPHDVLTDAETLDMLKLKTRFDQRLYNHFFKSTI